MNPMRTLLAVTVGLAALSCAPVAQAGGLGEVIFGLSRELELRGHAVDVILPKYDCLRYDQIYGLTVAYEDLWVPWYSGFVNCTVWFGFVHGRRLPIDRVVRETEVDRVVRIGHFSDARELGRSEVLPRRAVEVQPDQVNALLL